jgi:hypothetical protein
VSTIFSSGSATLLIPLAINTFEKIGEQIVKVDINE